MITMIEEFCLYNLDTAFSKTWPVEDFSKEMLANIDERSLTLQGYVETVLEGLQGVANMLTTKKQKKITLKSVALARSTITSKLRNIQQKHTEKNSLLRSKSPDSK